MLDLCTKIDKLNIGKVTMDILKDNQIETIRELCKYNKVKLTELGIEKTGISEIMISLQLLGLNIKPNHKSV